MNVAVNLVSNGLCQLCLQIMYDTGCPQMKQDSSANSKQMAALYGRTVQKAEETELATLHTSSTTLKLAQQPLSRQAQAQALALALPLPPEARLQKSSQTIWQSFQTSGGQ